jgi:hypothetical protein
VISRTGKLVEAIFGVAGAAPRAPATVGKRSRKYRQIEQVLKRQREPQSYQRQSTSAGRTATIRSHENHRIQSEEPASITKPKTHSKDFRVYVRGQNRRDKKKIILNVFDWIHEWKVNEIRTTCDDQRVSQERREITLRNGP